jgi:hypothetical protein
MTKKGGSLRNSALSASHQRKPRYLFFSRAEIPESGRQGDTQKSGEVLEII